MSQIKQITNEAKAIRSNNPGMSWQTALKKAGEYFRKGTTATKKAVKTVRKTYAKAKKSYCKPTTKKRVVKRKTMPKTLSGFSFRKFDDFAMEKGFKYKFSSLDTFLKFIVKNEKELFGRKITNLDWFDILDKYPALIDVMSYAKIDTDPLEDWDGAIEYWDNFLRKNRQPMRIKSVLPAKTSGIKKPTKRPTKKVPNRSIHKDTKSHNVRISVVSGVPKKGKTFGATPGPVDMDAVVEIELFIENDGQLYRQQTYPILKNLTKKYLKGTYNVDRAADLFRYLIDNGMKKYHKEYGGRGSKWFQLLSTSDRQWLAEKMAKDTLIELNSGNRWEL